MTLNGVMAVTLRYFTEVVNLRCRKLSVAEFMQESVVFLVRVQCRRKEGSRSLSHLLMSFLLGFGDAREPSPLAPIFKDQMPKDVTLCSMCLLWVPKTKFYNIL